MAPILPGTSFVFTSEVWKSAILEWSYRMKKYGFEVTFNGMTSILNLIKTTNWLKVIISDTAVSGRRLTAWAMAWPIQAMYVCMYVFK
jgi:hypothetical protein